MNSDERAGWLAVLQGAPASELLRLAAPFVADERFEWLRRPETGLVMVRARIGGGGDRFNVGEATVARCALRHLGRDGEAPVAGVGYVMGRDLARAECVAQVDALLQRDALHARIATDVLAPLRERRDEARARDRAAAEASRVRFFTLQPGVPA